MKTDKEIRRQYAQLLWQELKNKVRSEWQKKYSTYGENIERVELTTKFSQALCSDIKKDLQTRNLNYKVPYHLTLDKYFKQNGFPDNVQLTTLEVLSVYLGFANWKDFTRQTDLPAEEKKIHSSPAATTETPPPDRRKLLFFTFAILGFAFVTYNFLNNGNKPEPPQSEQLVAVRQVVENGMRAELAAYSAASDTPAVLLSLDSFFVKNSAPYKDIEERMHKNIARNWTLHNPGNPSTADLLKVQLDSIIDDYAYVTTEESWLIKYFNPAAAQYDYQYRAVNKQSYVLTRETGGDWKIISNEYQAQIGKEPPGVFDRAAFNDDISAAELRNQVRNTVQTGSLDFALWSLSVYTSLHKLPVENEVSVLQGRFGNLLRQWNLSKIDKEEFAVRKKGIMKEVLEILEKIN